MRVWLTQPRREKAGRRKPAVLSLHPLDPLAAALCLAASPSTFRSQFKCHFLQEALRDAGPAPTVKALYFPSESLVFGYLLASLFSVESRMHGDRDLAFLFPVRPGPQ